MRKVHISEKQLGIINEAITSDNPLASYGWDFKGKGLYEGLIHTYPAWKTCEYIENHLKLSKGSAYVEIKNGAECINVLLRNDSDETVKETAIKEVMDNLCGYNFYRKGVRDDGSEVKLSFEPKNPRNVREEMLENGHLIHVSSILNREKILSQGFVPKTRNEIFEYEDRIYFYSNEKDVQTILSMSAALVYPKDNSINNWKYDFYRVDVSRIPQDIEFYRDANSANGVAYWTHDNVPREAIDAIMTMELDKATKKWKMIDAQDINWSQLPTS